DPFCWNDYLSYFSFEDIAQGLHVTKLPNPPHTDQFHDVWKMIYEFNQYNMNAGWISCIYESMSVWLNKFCPGWMCIPQSHTNWETTYNL
ncbi:LOW QUALITY PROTEIN: hypothetical protein ACHAXS_000573, partial [Conticribra weissflogii]